MNGLMEILSGDGLGERRPREGGSAGAGVIVGRAIAETDGRRKKMEMETMDERCITERLVVGWRRSEECVDVGGRSVV